MAGRTSNLSGPPPETPPRVIFPSNPFTPVRAARTANFNPAVFGSARSGNLDAKLGASEAKRKRVERAAAAAMDEGFVITAATEHTGLKGLV